MAKAAATKKKTYKKKEKKNIPIGIVHIAASFNNTLISITDTEGNLVASRRRVHVGSEVRERGRLFAASRLRPKRPEKLSKPGCVRSRCV